MAKRQAKMYECDLYINVRERFEPHRRWGFICALKDLKKSFELIYKDIQQSGARDKRA